jgi:hypothetical protein
MRKVYGASDPSLGPDSKYSLTRQVTRWLALYVKEGGGVPLWHNHGSSTEYSMPHVFS